MGLTESRPDINKAAIAGEIFSGREKGSPIGLQRANWRRIHQLCQCFMALIGSKKISFWPINNKSTTRDL
jgi:hypothetical protein